MPQYTVQDPETGRTVTLEGDSAPTERELVKIFNQLKSPAEKATDLAGDLAVEVGSSLAGQALGAETGPGYLAIAPAAGAYGTYLRQKRQIDRGERDDYSYGEMITSGLINLIPMSAMAKGGASTAKYISKVAGIGAATQAVPQAVEVGQKAAEEKRFPSYDEYLSIGKKATEGAVIGGIAGVGFEAALKLSPAAKKLWSSLAGKTEAEANQTLATIASEGTQAEREAAGELVDTVGQQLGIVRPTGKSAQESAAVMGAIPTKSAKESAQVFDKAAEQAQMRREAFTKARAEEAIQEVKAAQLAGPEVTVLEGSPERAQLNILDTRPGASARERARLRQKLGINEEELPTTEDVLNEFAALPGIGSKQKARKFMEGGSTNVGLMSGVGATGVGAAALAALATSEAQAKPDTIVVQTPMGPLKYNANEMSLDDIQKDVSKKLEEHKKIQAAAPHLENRANYENAPTDEAKVQTLLDWSNSRKLAGEAAKTFVQAAGARLPALGRMAAGAGGEMARGYISGQPATTGSIVGAGVQSTPRGGMSFGENLLKFAGANVAGEQAKAAIDRGDLINFETFANAAARGGLQAAATSAVMASPLARGETKRQQQNRGEIEVFKDADRLGIVVDPASMTNPTIGQTAAVKLSGGSPRFNQDASRVNIPRVTEIFQGVAGRTGNPELDQNLSPMFFKARRLQEGRVYDDVARLPGMKQVVEDWKDANFNAAKMYAKNAQTGDPESLAAARKFKEQADDLFNRIETTTIRAGGSKMIDELKAAKTRIAQLHAMENAVNPADYKPDNVQLLGVMYRENPNYFTGDLGALARIAAAQPNAFQNIRMIGTKATTIRDMPIAAPGLRQFLQTQTGQRSIGNYGLEPTFLAQLARFGTGAAVPPPQSQPPR